MFVKIKLSMYGPSNSYINLKLILGHLVGPYFCFFFKTNKNSR